MTCAISNRDLLDFAIADISQIEAITIGTEIALIIDSISQIMMIGAQCKAAHYRRAIG